MESVEDISDLQTVNNLTSAKRIRKSVTRLSEVYDKTYDLKSERSNKPIVGNGVKLGDIIRIQNAVHRSKINSELSTNIHLICYKTKGKQTKRLIDIKKYNGFDANDELEFKKRISLTEKMKLDDLKLICDLFNVHPTGKQKKDIVLSIVEYLKCPFETGSENFRMKALKQKTKSKTQTKAMKTKNSSDINKNADSISEVDDFSEVEKGKTENHSENSTVIDKENVVKKPRVRKSKPTESKDIKKERSSTNKKEKKQSNVVKATIKSKSDKIDSSCINNDSINSSIDDDLLSDTVLKEKISTILKGADPNTITLNQVCDGVTAQFPDRDLLDKRQHIKSLVKQVIDQD